MIDLVRFATVSLDDRWLVPTAKNWLAKEISRLVRDLVTKEGMILLAAHQPSELNLSKIF